MASPRLWCCGLWIAGMASLCAARPIRCTTKPYRPQFHSPTRLAQRHQRPGLLPRRVPLLPHSPPGPELDYPGLTGATRSAAISVDWGELPPAMAPDETDPPASGSAVVDRNNTSGLQTGAEQLLVAFYTGARYLNDRAKDGVHLHGLQQRPRPHLDQVREEPRRRGDHPLQPRPKGLLARADAASGSWQSRFPAQRIG